MRAWIKAGLFIVGIWLCMRLDVLGIALIATAILMGPDHYTPRYKKEED